MHYRAWRSPAASPRPAGVALRTLEAGCARRVRGCSRFGGAMFEGLFQPMHLLIIFAIALLVFGPKKLPELGKGLGEGIRALKDGMKDHTTDATVKTDGKPENKA